MRRVAASIVFVNREEAYTNHIVEIYGSRVVNHYALKSELAMTEWLGGIIVLTHADNIDLKGAQSVGDFFSWIEKAEPPQSRYLRAYHLKNVDIATRTLTPNSRIYLIEEDGNSFIE